MPYKITNVSLEHQHTLKRRMASCLQMEPIVAGKRLMLRQSTTITDEQYKINKDNLAKHISDGVLTVEEIKSAMPFIPLHMPVVEPEVKKLPALEQILHKPKTEEVEVIPSPPPVQIPVVQQQVAQTVPNTPNTANRPPQPQQRKDDRNRGR